MRRCRRLDALASRYRRNVERHERRFLEALRPTTTTRERDGGIALAAIEVLNTWGSFTRAYWLSSFGEPRTASGLRIRCGHSMLASDPLGFAITTFRPNAVPKGSGRWDRRLEPSWHDPQTLLKLTREAGLTSAGDVATAFSIDTRVFYDLPVLRNYFAHRNEDTYLAALRIAALNSMATPRRPFEVLAGVSAGRTQTLFREWLGDLDLVTDYLCA
jgi:hypothetical protein